MLSFNEKRAIFQSFHLKEKKISNGRVNFVYPESKQKGQILATQLHPSGNGYVIGKYMSEEIIKKHHYKVDRRGWISIKKFSKEELLDVISHAKQSMSAVQETEDVLKEAPQSKIRDEAVITMRLEEIPEKETQSVTKPHKGSEPASPFEMYLGSCLFTWIGLTLSTMEYGYLVWKKALRNFGIIHSKN